MLTEKQLQQLTGQTEAMSPSSTSSLMQRNQKTMAGWLENTKNRQNTSDYRATPEGQKGLEQTKKSGYFERVFGAYKEAGEDIMSGVQKGAEQMGRGIKKGKSVGGFMDMLIGGLRGGLRTVGGVAGATFAPITEAPGIKQALEGIGTGISKIPGVEELARKATILAENNPEIAKDLGDIVNIAVLGTGKAVAKPVGTVVTKAGKAVETSGVKAAQASKKSFVDKLIRPVENKAELISQVPRTTEKGWGIFKRSEVAPTISEANMIKEVTKIPGILVKNTVQRNFNIIKKEVIKKAKQLKIDIAKNDFIISKKEVLSRLKVSAQELIESPLIVGSAEKTANKLLDKAIKIVKDQKGTGSGIFRARKLYDRWVLRQKPKAFDAKAENAFTIANRQVRDTLNTILDEKAANLGIKDSLKSQSTLFRSMENIAPKAAIEANKAIGRSMQRIGKILGTRSRVTQGLAAAAGIGVLSASAAFALPLTIATGTGYFLFRSGKFILKPAVRIQLGKLIKTSGHLISAEDKKIIQEVLEVYKD